MTQRLLLSFFLLLSSIAISVAQSLAVEISSSKTNVCHNDTVTLFANTTGAADPDSVEYHWSFYGKGSLQTDFGETTKFFMGDSGDVFIYVQAIEESDTATDSITLFDAGFKLNLVSSPDTLVCNSSLALTASITGSSLARDSLHYTWSTLIFGDTPTVKIEAASNYGVTVKNNFGCSASASRNIIYPNGPTNHLDFRFVCWGCDKAACAGNYAYLLNLSQYHDSPWKTKWNFFPDTTHISILDSIGDYGVIYPQPGIFKLGLQMDSAGCKFYMEWLIQVKPHTNPLCYEGIEETEFAKTIQLYPNPTPGLVNFKTEAYKTDLSFEVYNTLGLQEKFFTLTTASQILDFQDLVNGIYFIIIHWKDEIALKRLCISK